MFFSHPFLDHPHIAHGFFGREGGVSEGIYRGLNCGPGSKDDPARVAENRRRVAASFSRLESDLCTLYQIHSADVVTVNAPFMGERPQADAMVTNRPGVVLGILTADCAPVLFTDPVSGVIGAAHAGWKGAYGGIIENTVAAMEKLGAQRHHIGAVIGPCIAQASYEVGPEFIARFTQHDQAQYFVPSTREGHAQFDLSAFVAAALRRASIAHAAALMIDTCANEQQFFSYRRTTLRGEPDYGRHISAIMLAR